MSAPAKIHVLMSDMGVGGAERVMLALAGQFHRSSPVVFVCLRQQGALLEAVAPGMPVIFLSTGNVPRWRMTAAGFLSIVRLMRSEPESIFLATGTGTNILACAARLFSHKGARLVIREACSSRNSTSGVLSVLKRLLYRFADGMIGVSDGVAEELKTLARRNQPVISIPNPVDVPQLQTLAEIPDVQLSQFPHRYVLTVGRLVSQKNTALLIDAYARIESNICEHLVIIGDGPLRDELRKSIDRHGLTLKIHMLGEIANPHPWYKRASVFVLSSDSEGYPNVLLESLVHGLPVVSTDCMFGPRQILDNGRYGTLLPVNDVDAMANVISMAVRGNTVHDIWDPNPFNVPAVAARYLAFMESCPDGKR